MKLFGRGPLDLGRAMLALAVVPMAPLSAQVAPANGADSVGPSELRNYSLGTPPPLTAEPTTPPPEIIAVPSRRTHVPPAATSAKPAARPATTVETALPPAASVPVERAPVAQNVPKPSTVRASSTTGPAQSVTVALPPADPLTRSPTPANDADGNRLSSQPSGMAPGSEPPTGDDRDALWMGIVGLLLAALGGLIYAFRRRFRPIQALEPAFAAEGLALPSKLAPRSFPPTPPPPPPPSPYPPAPSGGITVKRPVLQPATEAGPRPDAVPARAGGIVSTRLRPWLELEFEPTRAVIDGAQASVQFDVVVTNSGNAPARNVLVEACMINASPEQDRELRAFFDRPVGQGDRIDAIPPLARIALKSAVSLPLEQVRAYEVEGRRLFVPLVAFNALYEWGASEGQSSASFILGRGEKDGEAEPGKRMAPLRLDLGPRVFRELDSRRHALEMRR